MQYAKSFITEGGMDVSKMETAFDQIFKPNKFFSSPVNYGLVTYNLSKNEPVIMTKKDLTKENIRDYVIASASCYPAFKPHIINNELYIDGGYYDNLPINLAIDMGANEIIAIDLRAIGINQKIKNNNVNIIKIEPNNQLDSVFKFDEKAINHMIKLGYNDTLKKFNKYEGKIYTFKKGTIMKFNFRYKNKINNIKNIIGYDNDFDDDLIIKTIEYGLEMFNCDIEKIYDLKLVNKILLEKMEVVDEIEFDKFDINEIKKIFDDTIITKYIYLKIKKCDKINKIFSFFSKEVALAIYLNAVR